MARIGYARVSSTGQSLDVQLTKLHTADCDPIFQEKHTGTTDQRAQLQECLRYLRKGDTLVITRLDRLARSVVHLAQLAERFHQESIDLVVLDQNIDTSTSTGRLLFNLLASIAEFENELRRERQVEGIAKAKQQGVKFGRSLKILPDMQQQIHARRTFGATIGQLVQEFNISRASVYRTLKSTKSEIAIPEKEIIPKPITKTTKVLLWLMVENNNKFVRGKKRVREEIERWCLSEHNAKKLSKEGWEYELTFEYENDKDLEDQIYDLCSEMSNTADAKHCFIEADFSEVGTDRTW